MIEQFPYLRISYMGTLYNDKEGIVSYINKDEGFTSSLEILNRYLNPDSTEKPEYISTSLNAEDITILFGDENLPESNTEETE
jgi:hypothetical protein